MDDCPFCRIEPARIVAETELTLTIRDGFPVSPGHTLIIPKRHFAESFEATDAEAAGRTDVASFWAVSPRRGRRTLRCQDLPSPLACGA
jgi:diadenosine tetraphosphate (Ap4A) HIT family hydrolase